MGDIEASSSNVAVATSESTGGWSYGRSRWTDNPTYYCAASHAMPVLLQTTLLS